uniref:GMEB1/2/Spe-44-like domain-containing protein n=1 Tax=Ditylenchus dipsaci TaxID=166011 RepID=A0A915CQ71_9BILA
MNGHAPCLTQANDVNLMSVVENAAARRSPEENAVTSVGNIKKIMESSPVLFWSRMKELGIVEDLLNILSTTVDQLKHIYLHAGPNTEEFAAEKLSSLANTLDLGLIYGEKIHGRYVQTTLESSLITKELQELQRKAEEQKRKLETAKRKSQVFDQIIKNTDQQQQPEMKKFI